LRIFLAIQMPWILPEIVTLDSQEPKTGKKKKLGSFENQVGTVYCKIPTQGRNVFFSSMFALDSKIAFISTEPDADILPSEQLVTLCFHQYEGAYALLLETPLIQGQLRRLATGTVQRFVQPSALKSVMIPRLEAQLAKRWHQQLIQILDNRQQALARMTELTPKIQTLFEQQHNINQHQTTHKMGASAWTNNKSS